MIEVGLMLDMRNPPRWRRPWDRFYAQTLELVEEAECLGARSVWTSEHHFFEDGYLPQPLTLASALAARTKAMRIGTAILVAPLRSALQIAEEAAVVDLVSGGRLDLGLGAGYRLPEFEAFGADHCGRFATLRRRVQEVQELLAGGHVTPPAIQDPLPIWFGAGAAKAARYAGRMGLPLLNAWSEVAEPYLEGLREGGHDPRTGRMAGLLNLLIADDPEEAWARARSHIEYQWNSYGRYGVEGLGVDPPPPIDAEAMRKPRADGCPPFLGAFTPEQAASMIAALARRGPVESVHFWASMAGLPDDLARRHVELVCTRLRAALESVGPERGDARAS